MADERPAPPPETPAESTTESTTPGRPRLRDRLWTFKAMLLVACATLLVGGLAGAGIVAVADDDGGERRGPHVMFDREHPGRPGPPGDRRPWQHRHFYWNDTPAPSPSPPSPQAPPPAD